MKVKCLKTMPHLIAGNVYTAHFTDGHGWTMRVVAEDGIFRFYPKENLEIVPEFVKCIQPREGLTLGQVYGVTKVTEKSYRIINDHGDWMLLRKDRFVVVDGPEQPQEAPPMPAPIPLVEDYIPPETVAASPKKDIIAINPKAKMESKSYVKAFMSSKVVNLILLSDLPFDKKTEALGRLRIVFVSLPPYRQEQFLSAEDIDTAFVWDTTPFSHAYWHNLHTRTKP